MKTKLRLVKIDVTHNWNEDFLNQIGASKVFDYCLYDENEVTYCCEYTPSFWLIPVYSETENYLEDSQYDEFVYHNSLDPFYMHCPQVEELDHVSNLEEFDFKYRNTDDKIYYNEMVGEVEEVLRCNPVY